MQEHEKVGHDIFHFVGDENLPAVELDFVFIQFKIIFHFRKVKNPGEVEGIIHIEVNPEERIFGERV